MSECASECVSDNTEVDLESTNETKGRKPMLPARDVTVFLWRFYMVTFYRCINIQNHDHVSFVTALSLYVLCVWMKLWTLQLL